MSSVIALNQIDGSELWKKVGFKHSEKVLVALRGVYNLPFNLDDPVDNILFTKLKTKCKIYGRGLQVRPRYSVWRMLEYRF